MWILWSLSFSRKYTGIFLTIFNCWFKTPSQNRFFKTAWLDSVSFMKQLLKFWIDFLKTKVKTIWWFNKINNWIFSWGEKVNLEAPDWRFSLKQLQCYIQTCFDTVGTVWETKRMRTENVILTVFPSTFYVKIKWNSLWIPQKQNFFQKTQMSFANIGQIICKQTLRSPYLLGVFGYH